MDNTTVNLQPLKGLVFIVHTENTHTENRFSMYFSSHTGVPNSNVFTARAQKWIWIKPSQVSNLRHETDDELSRAQHRITCATDSFKAPSIIIRICFLIFFDNFNKKSIFIRCLLNLNIFLTEICFRIPGIYPFASLGSWERQTGKKHHWFHQVQFTANK